VIDCHTHFYDPTRPQGVPWPAPRDKQLYRPVYPADYERLAIPLGITGTVVVEASEWVADNQWVLDLAAKEPFIRGLVGHLNPAEDSFGATLRKYTRNPLFRGIRVRDAARQQLNSPAMVRNLALLADAGLALDVNGGPDSLPSIQRLARAVPTLPIVIDHVSNVRIDGRTPPQEWLDGMRAVADEPGVCCKVSGLVEGSGRAGAAPESVDFYRPVLDHIWSCFGADRLIFGSNWPVSEIFAPLSTVYAIVRSYFAALGGAASHKVFSGNAARIYKWVHR